MNQIQLIQKPKITHDLESVGRSVTERIDALNLANQVATDDTIQTLKKLRAELTKEKGEYDTQVRSVCKIGAEPFDELKTTYKAEVSLKYENADNILKTKIGEYEEIIKTKKREDALLYFSELCLSENIDFVKFESVGLKIDLTVTLKKLKEQCSLFLFRVKEDLALIKTQEHEPEILVEYKKSLNVSNAITTINERKLAEKKEAQRIKDLHNEQRRGALRGIALVYDPLTKCFAFNDDIYMTESDAFSLEQAEFEAKVDVLKGRIKQTLNPILHAPVAAPSIRVAEQTVIEDASDEVCDAAFKVTAKRSELLALGKYMRENNITYQNIQL